MSHTPGPWRYQREINVEGRRHVTKFEVYTASGVFGHPATCDVEANARLISAAPDLLEALREALKYIEIAEERDLIPSTSGEGFKLAQAAIAKAEGR